MACSVIGVLGRRMSWLLIVVLSLAACTTFNVRVADPELPTAQTQPILDHVGVYFSPDFRRIDVDDPISQESASAIEYGLEMHLKTDLGPASVRMFESILKSSFPNAVITDNAGPDAQDAMVLTPSLLDFDYEVNLYDADISVDIVYLLTITSPDRRPISLEIHGRYDKGREENAKFAPIWSAAPRCIQEAMRNAATQLSMLLHQAAATDDWLSELEKVSVSTAE